MRLIIPTLIFATLALLFFRVSAEASEMSWVTAGMANKYCANPDKLDNETRIMMKTTCATSMMDAYLVAATFLDNTICLPKNALETQSLATLVASYQLRHLDEIKDTEPLLFVAIKALEETWPCKRK